MGLLIVGIVVLLIGIGMIITGVKSEPALFGILNRLLVFGGVLIIIAGIVLGLIGIFMY